MNPSEKHTLEIDSVELSFGDRRILSGVYLAVETGGVSAVLGRNGCGKSCLMKILCGSLRAGFRSMRIDGVWHDRFRADEVRYLPQQGFIPGWLTLDRVLRDYDMTRGDLLKWFPLFEKLFGTKIYAMSGGERRILECYLILRSPTRFILLDEPFSQVAPLHVSALKRLILQERASKGILLTDHMHRHVTDLCTAPQKLDTFGVFFMKYNYEIRLKAVKLVLEGGLSVREAGCHLGCGRSQVHLWVTLFERHGLAGLKLRHGSYSAEFKLSVLKHMHQNHLSLLETAVHFGIPGPFVIRQWERLYQNQGAEGLRRKPQRRRPAMSKSKTKKVKLKTTPHEELLKELEYLRAENAYLKKLQALVEERIVRESGKEPKPSKD